MNGNKNEVIERLQNKDGEKVFIIENMETKKGRSLAQNRTWSKILTAIGLVKSWDLAEAKKITLIYCFGFETKEYEGELIYIPNHISTAKLNIKEGIKYLDFLISYCKDNKIPVQITPREIQSLYDSFNN